MKVSVENLKDLKAGVNEADVDADVHADVSVAVDATVDVLKSSLSRRYIAVAEIDTTIVE